MKNLSITIGIALMSLACNLQANNNTNTTPAETAAASEAPAMEYGVKGCVVDSLTHEGEPMATVRIWKSGTKMDNDKVATAGTTDVDGNFDFVIKQKGDYIMIITSVGRTPITRMFSVNKNKQTANLGTLFIAESAQNLEDVVIAIQKPLVKMTGDKIAYSVQDDPDAKTNTVLDMLRKVPMVTVDGDDNITVNGSSSFQVFMNGKPSAMLSSNPKETLKAIPAEGIKNIEVLTNPGAKYDAEGVGGILNIVTEQKQGMEGYTANVSLQGGRMNGATVYVMTQKEKLTLSVNAHEGYLITPAVESMTESDQYGNGQHSLASTEMKSGTNILFGTVDATYQIDEHNTLSATANVMDTRSDVTTDISSTFRYDDGYAPLMSNYSQRNDNKMISTSVNGSVDFVHTFGDNPAHTLTAAYRISTQPKKNDNSTEYSLASMPSYDMVDKNNMLENTLQLDYVLPVTQNQTFETGGKYVWRKGTSTSSLLDYTHRNQVGALYTTYGVGLGKYNVKAGVRYEHTAQEVKYNLGNGADFDLTYDNVVPNLSLSMQPTLMQNLTLGYNMRISRPGISVLNPYRNTQNVTSVSYGNPDLEVEKVHNTQLTYNYYSPKVMLNASLLYSYQDNGIEQYSFVDDGNVLYSTYGNIAKRQNTSLSIFASMSLTPKTRLTLNSTTSYLDLRAASMNLGNSGWQQSLMANLQQNLPWNMKLSAMYMLNTPTLNLQGKTSGINIHTLGLTKSACNDRLSIGINAINPFQPTMKMEVKSQGSDYKSKTTTNVKMFSVVASVSYRFGDMKMKQKTTRTADESDLHEVKEDSMNEFFMQ